MKKVRLISCSTFLHLPIADNDEDVDMEEADTLYEYVNKGEENQNDKQALGPTDEPQMVKEPVGVVGDLTFQHPAPEKGRGAR